MITIKGSSETISVIKKSKFIGLAVRVGSEAEAQSHIELRKKQHYDATHNCYAYLLENGVMRYSDDGEPQGTAGIPMLEVLKRSGLTDVLVVCTRYFGGTLLGAGGLVRAYSGSAADALASAQKVRLVQCSLFDCAFSYNVWSKAEKALLGAGYSFEDIKYSDEVSATVCVTAGGEEAFLEHVKSLSLGKSLPVFIEQKFTELPLKD